MARKNFDKIDVFLSTAFVVFNLVSLEKADIDLFGTQLAESVYSFGGTSLSIAFLGSIGVFGFAYLTNNSASDLKDYANEYMYTVLGTLTLIVSIQFVPAVRDAATSSDLAVLTVLGVEAMGYAAVSYLA
jgi:hypothetical protein